MTWAESAFRAIEVIADKRILRGSFTVEELRENLLIDPPHDGRAWGAVASRAIMARLIEPTGEYRPAKSSHGSPKPCYRFVPRGWRK